MHRIDPLPGQVGQSRPVMSRSQNAGLKPRHLAGRGSLAINSTAPDNLAHHWIMRQAVCIVDIWISCEPPEG